MKKATVKVRNIVIPVYHLETVVVGSGCAGYNAADWLYCLGQRDIAMISEGVNMGTSRNTGSDKQTYYKLSLASDGSDSVAEMAKTLFSGGSVNGDTALVEAACSVKSFIKLANLGVPFPTNEYGEYVGYKTDHDPRQRATSAGPLTSKYMTECLQKEVEAKNIAVLDGMMAARLLVKEGRLIGMLAVDKTTLSEPNRGITLFACGSLILASGGPASIYYNSVYPESQTGMTGMALEAGAEACNIEEWQYGIASTNFRWNVSGTYQQVIPKYIAVDAQGREREFLPEYFGDPVKAADMVFLKGYQWPFDAMKTYGSSMIDMAIHHEIFDLGNSIFLDFRTNPAGFENGFGALSPEACSYLKNSDALFDTPLERLQKMNPQAVDLYREHHIDLCTELLEVSVCAQHNNGGLRVDLHWQSNIHGLYVAGEAAGTFGVYRPGGAALNSTQVGSMRAAEDIVYGRQRQRQGDEEFLNLVQCDVTAFMDVIEKIEKNMTSTSDILQNRTKAQKLMSKHAAYIRDPVRLAETKEILRIMLRNFFEDTHIASVYEIPDALKNRDILLTQAAVLDAMIVSSSNSGSRGSAIVLDPSGAEAGTKLGSLRFSPATDAGNDSVLVTLLRGGDFVSSFCPVRTIPQTSDWFESVWSEYCDRVNRKNRR